MKYDCNASFDRKHQWHKWFAWYPVQLSRNDCRWLEYVERKGTYRVFGWDFADWRWEYRPCKN